MGGGLGGRQKRAKGLSVRTDSCSIDRDVEGSREKMVNNAVINVKGGRGGLDLPG